MRPVSIATAALLLALLPLPGAAEEPVLPDAFGARFEGLTLHFSRDGLPYGSEQFFPGRRTLWQAWDGSCLVGRWYGDGDLVCFVYEDDPDPQCWRLRETAGWLRAVLVEGGAETDLDLELTGIDDAPLACPGPDVGS